MTFKQRLALRLTLLKRALLKLIGKKPPAVIAVYKRRASLTPRSRVTNAVDPDAVRHMRQAAWKSSNSYWRDKTGTDE